MQHAAGAHATTSRNCPGGMAMAGQQMHAHKGKHAAGGHNGDRRAAPGSAAVAAACSPPRSAAGRTHRGGHAGTAGCLEGPCGRARCRQQRLCTARTR
eukprot:4451775-Pleurochrysis_carterae.AAC.2